MNLLDRIEQTILEQHLFEKGEKIIVAVSGGPDSIALLHLLYRLIPTWGFTIIVAHVDHGFRGEQSAQDARFVRQFAEQLGLVFEMKAIDMPEYIRRTGENAQEAARDIRYAYLGETAKRYGTNKIALGHHANDQAETVLMRIIRGSSLAGLGGMTPQLEVNGYRIVRPLLGVTKDELIQYCHREQISYVTDASNLKPIYFRNSVRLETIPFLKRYNPQIEQALIRLSDIVRPEHEFMEQLTKETFDEIVVEKDGSFLFSRNSFLSLHLALQRRLITLILRYLSSHETVYEFEQVEIIRKAIQQKGTPSMRLDIGRGLCFIREYDRIHIGYEESGVEDAPQPLYIDRFPCNRVFAPGIEITAEVRNREERVERTKFDDEYTLELDFDQVVLPLQVRTRNPGDRMRVKGLNGSKKVKDIFIDAKVAPSLRDRLPLFVDGSGEVLWIPSIRRSEIAQVNVSTTNILHIKCRLPFELHS